MKFTVRFLPEDRSIEAKQPLELMLAAMRCGLWLEQPCGAKQSCGKCRVRLSEGKAAITAADRALLTKEEIAAGWRLGCTLVLRSSVTVEVPELARTAADQPFGGSQLFAAGFQPSEIEAGDTSGRAFGVAFDMGTTTLAAALVNLRDGQVLDVASRLNPQARFGADVISRIRYAQDHSLGSAELHECLRQAIAEMIEELASRAGVDAKEVAGIVFAGNSLVTHTALGMNLAAPRTGPWTEEQTLRGRELSLPAHPDACVRFLPMVGSHIGGDVVAAALAAGLDRSNGVRLLVDLGTSTELMLACRGRLLAASTAAGPVFEGGNIVYGMRAEPGAINAVRVSPGGELTVNVIGDEPPRGLCAGGLLDAVAELLRAGAVLPSGYLKSHEQMTVAPPALREHCRRLRDGQHGVLLAGTVVLSAHDVRQVQLAKAGVRAAAELLLRHAGIAAEALEEVCIAAPFGSFLRKAALVALGLVPEVDPERVHFIGNAAGTGARMVLVDTDARRRAQEIARRCEYADLAGHPDYEATFAAALAFPSSKR